MLFVRISSYPRYRLLIFFRLYSEGTNGRTLNGATTAADTMTVEMCTTFCGNGGFTYAGVEYGYGPALYLSDFLD